MSSENENIFGDSSKENFEPIKSGNNGARFFLIFIILGILGFSVYYFFLRKGNISKEEEMIANSIAEEFADNQALPSEDDVEVENFKTAPPKAEIVNVTERTNNYYLVVGSFVDKYLAEDLAQKIVNKGKVAYIIHPESNSIYYIVAVSKSESLQDAENDMKELKKEYSTTVWIKRY